MQKCTSNGDNEIIFLFLSMDDWWIPLPNEINEPSIDDIKNAQNILKDLGCLYRIPLIPVHLTNDELNNDTCIYLKLENLQAIGSFKLRPAANVLLNYKKISKNTKTRVITPSAGNMGQGVAWIVNYLNNKNTTSFADQVLVIAPDHLPKSKQLAMERLGASCITVPFDTWWTVIDQNNNNIQDNNHYKNNKELKDEIEKDKHLWENIFVHPVYDKLVMAGNGTIGLEIIEDLKQIDSVIIPYGGGALSIGIATAIRNLSPLTKIYAVEVETAAPLSVSWNSGKPEKVEYIPSFVDGMGGSSVLPEMFRIARKLLDGVIVVSLDDITKAIKIIAERNKTIVEGAGGAALAAAMSGKAGKGNIVCICSGGGLNNSILSSILLYGNTNSFDNEKKNE